MDYKYEKLKTLTDERVVKGDHGLKKSQRVVVYALVSLSDSVQTMKGELGGREN